MSIFRTGLLSGAVLSAATFIASAPIRAADSDPIFVEQGSDWKPTTRANFYTQDQGSRIMPLSCLKPSNSPMGRRFWLTVSAATVICETPPTATVCRWALPPRDHKATNSPE